MVDAEKTELEIDHTRSKYIPVATRTQLLFFCTTDLSNIDPMYQYSLEWFITIFLNSIASAERAGEVLMLRVSAIEFGSEGRYPAEFEVMAVFCLSLQPARFKVQRGCRVSYWMYRVHVHLWKNAFGCKMLSLLLLLICTFRTNILVLGGGPAWGCKGDASTHSPLSCIVMYVLYSPGVAM